MAMFAKSFMEGDHKKLVTGNHSYPDSIPVYIYNIICFVWLFFLPSAWQMQKCTLMQHDQRMAQQNRES
jgi:hypothetical protein